MNLASAFCGLLIASFLLSAGCGKRHMQIDRETRRAIDTLSAHEISDLRPVMDSLCAAKMDSLVATMKDSILITRKAEMRKLLGK